MARRNFFIFISLVLAAVVWYTYYSAAFIGLVYNDAMDYASLARNVMRGEGFVSAYFTPLNLIHKQGIPQPDLWRAPLWPAAMAVFLKVFGSTDKAVVFATGFFYIAAAPVIFLLARHWFDDTIAFTGTLIYIFSAKNLQFSISGLTEPIALFLMVLTIYLASAPWNKSWWGDILLGSVIGIFYLARYNALLFIPFFAIYRWYQTKPERHPALITSYRNELFRFFKVIFRFGTAALLTMSPWLIRNYMLTGSPMFSLQKYEPAMFTRAYPEYSLYMLFDRVDIVNFLKQKSDMVWEKIFLGWEDFYTNLFNPDFTGISPYLFGLFLLSLLIPFGIKQRGTRLLVICCFLSQLAALLVIHYIPRLFFIFMPVYIIYGMAAVHFIAGKIFSGIGLKSFNQQLATVLLTCLTAAFFISGNLPQWHKNDEQTGYERFRESIGVVQEITGRSDVVTSNDGHLIAWYGDRNAVKLPFRVDLLPELEKRIPVNVIYLSGWMSWNLPEADGSWLKLYWGQPGEVYGYKLYRKFPDGSLIYKKRESPDVQINQNI